MSLKNLKNIEENSDLNFDQESLIEVGDIAILGSSKASLHYQNINEIHIRKQLLDPSIDKLLEKNEITGVTEGKKRKNGFFLSYRGYIYGIISAFSFCLSQIFMKRAKWFSAADHATIRYSSAFLIMAIFMKSKGMDLTGPKKQFKLILFRGFIGSLALLSIYFAVMLINPSDVVSLTHSSLIITAIMSRVFLKEKLTIAHVSSIFLTAIGVICITKPSFLFPKKIDVPFNLSNMTRESIKTMEDYKLPAGISMTFLAAFLTSCVFLVLKKLSNSKVHWAYSTICISWFGFPLSLILSILLTQLGYYHQNFLEEKNEILYDVFYSLAASSCSLFGQIFLNISFKYEDATKVAITKTTDVFFSFWLQYFFLDILVDKWKIIGALSILSGTFIVLLYKIFEDRDTRLKSHTEMENGLDEKKTTIKDVLLKIILFKF